MKLESVEIKRYGRISGLRCGRVEAALPSLVVVLGPNESGKSTFFSFLTELLYGFRPATLDNHPYAPWTGDVSEGRARILLDAGESVEVHRRLLASGGWGRTTRDGRTEDMRNRPLPFVQHVSREVFRQVYAISLPDLSVLERESWERVQERLTGAMGASDLRSAQVVAEEFHRDANALWRPDKRGRPQVRALQDERQKLVTRRQQAEKWDRELRAQTERRDTVEQQLAAARQAREEEAQRGKALEEELNRLRHVARTLARIQELREQVSDGAALEGLPADPAAERAGLRQRRRRAQEQIAKCEERIKAAEERIRAYRERHERTAEAEAQVRKAAQRIGELPKLEQEAEKAESEAAEAEEQWDERARGFFSGPWDEWDEAAKGALQAVPAAELGSRVQVCRDLAQRRQRVEDERARKLAGLRDAPRPRQWRLVGGVLLVVGAAVAIAIGLGAFPGWASSWAALPSSVDPLWVLGLAVLLALAGIAMVFTWLYDYRRAGKRDKQAEAAVRQGAARINEVEAQRRTARAEVAELVDGIPVLPERLARPESGLAEGLERAAETADALIDRWRAAEGRRRRLEAARSEIIQLLEVSGLGDETPREDADALLGALDAALEARTDAKAARDEQVQAEAEQSLATRSDDEAAKALGRLESRLGPLGDGDPDRGAAAAAKMLRDRDRADSLEEELRRDHPDLGDPDLGDPELGDPELGDPELGNHPDLKERQPSPNPAEAEKALDASIAKQQELAGEVESRQTELASLRTDLRHMQKRETADRATSRIAQVDDRIRDVKRQRDRAFLLARLVEEADRRFRDENQPELLRHAGRHLRAVTRGRYDRIEVHESGDRTLLLRGPAEPTPRTVGGSLSQGTKEQVYLALRLAIVDRLDDGQETLPLFMDEVLVNWDAARRDQALDLLERVSQTRQIFFFTCHPQMAAELEDRGGAILPLDA